MRTHFFLAVIFFSIFVPACLAQEIRVAAAADLQFALTDLAAQYEKQSGTKVSISFGSSGNFFAQIENGAPFDIFFSADSEYPRKLEAAGLAEPGTLAIYAKGRIALWAPAGSPFDFEKNGLSTLLDDKIQKLAIANPEHAPYGRAAVAALKQAGLYEQLKSKFVIGENISQAAQFVQSGSAQAGIVALSLALSPAMKDGQRWLVPENLYPPLDQSVVILKSSTSKAAAKAFLEFLHTVEAQSTLSRYGFTLPAGVAGKSAKP
ncbi:MAG: molybdate ABC transporter substrate-binding protein [Candidatus Acidiferrum sp.]